MAKKKPGKVNRVCYIDATLDAKMKKAGDVNWSAVASAAFERELELRERSKGMNEVIERMRREYEEDQTEAYQEGEAAGREWATKSARPRELRRLDRWLHGFGHDYERVNVFITDVIREITGGERDDAASWFDEEVEYPLEDESLLDDESFVRGFVDGALQVWSEVEPHL